jgi:N-acetylglucosaminyldiphosphoundecaprenol N-acetyl-beta-D-mannosaminyltransferase
MSAGLERASATRVWLGPVPADAIDLPGALERIGQMAEAGAGGVVYTPNVDHLVNAREDAAFRDAYAAADLSLVDGTPVLWLCRMLGVPLREKVSGSDLVRPLMRLAAERGFRVFLLGAAPGVAQRAAELLAREAPGLRIVGTSSPRIDMARPAQEREAVRQDLARTRPDLVLVALGAPKAEKFSHECRQLLPGPVPVFVCVGAGLDFVAGVVRRSPPWMSRVGLEWTYRLAQEPRRLWRRYLLRGPRALPLFAGLLIDRARGRAGLDRAASRS